jgi:alcohol dehydrogenase class IV
VPQKMLPEVAAEAMQSAAVRANPKPVAESDLIELLRAAW